MRVGLFGGTFDPIHQGHLDVARAAQRALDLVEVWILPARIPPHRSRPHASAAHRFAMAALATAGDARLVMSDLEMDTDGPAYTATTLDRLAAGGLDTGTFCFITGADAFIEIRSWKDFPALLDRCDFAVVARPGTPTDALPGALPELAERMEPATAAEAARTRILLVDAPTSPVSSTDVRRARAAGQPLAGLVPPAVAGYIERHVVYGPRGGARDVSEATA